MTAHPNSARWCLKPPRKGHVDLRASAQKPDYVREMTVRAAWVAEWKAAVSAGNGARAKELEGLLGSSPISELKGKGKR